MHTNAGNSDKIRQGDLPMFMSSKKKIFCAFCSLPQRIYTKKHINIFEMFGFAAVGVIVTYLVWQDFHWVGVIIFGALAFSAEMTHRLRWRNSITCKNCGFDPITYKRSPDRAAQTVKSFLEQRKEDPLYLLKPQPKIAPIIKKIDSETYARKVTSRPPDAQV